MAQKNYNPETDVKIIRQATQRMIGAGCSGLAIEVLEAAEKMVPAPFLSADQTMQACLKGHAAYKAGQPYMAGDELTYSERREWRRGWMAAAAQASISQPAADALLVNYQSWCDTLKAANTVIDEQIARTQLDEKKPLASLSLKLTELFDLFKKLKNIPPKPTSETKEGLTAGAVPRSGGESLGTAAGA